MPISDAKDLVAEGQADCSPEPSLDFHVEEFA
jgi:hypothetical protein